MLPLAIVGLIGNLFVIIVTAAKRRLHTMHYFFLANLSLSDFLFHIIFSFNAINFISENSVFGTSWCQGIPYLLRCFLVTTIFLLCAVTWECHMSVVRKPYQFSSEITVKKVAVVLFLWVASFLVAVVSIILGGRSINYNNKTLECELDPKSPDKSNAVVLIATTLIFIIPFGLIGTQQYQICRVVKHQLTQIRQQQRAVNTNNPEGQRQQIFMTNVKESKDAFITVVAFLLSYLPMFVMASLQTRLPESDAMYDSLFSASLLIQAGSTWNPVIYCFRKRQFRRQCMQFVCKKCFKEGSSEVSPE